MPKTTYISNEKTAIHPIIIAIILITIIIAVAGIAYIWMVILNRSGNQIYNTPSTSNKIPQQSTSKTQETEP